MKSCVSAREIGFNMEEVQCHRNVLLQMAKNYEELVAKSVYKGRQGRFQRMFDWAMGEVALVDQYIKALDKPKIKTCPFCEGQAEVDLNDDAYRVVCLSCGAATAPIYADDKTFANMDKAEEAIKLWNTRFK